MPIVHVPLSMCKIDIGNDKVKLWTSGPRKDFRMAHKEHSSDAAAVVIDRSLEMSECNYYIYTGDEEPRYPLLCVRPRDDASSAENLGLFADADLPPGSTVSKFIGDVLGAPPDTEDAQRYGYDMMIRGQCVSPTKNELLLGGHFCNCAQVHDVLQAVEWCRTSGRSGSHEPGAQKPNVLFAPDGSIVTQHVIAKGSEILADYDVSGEYCVALLSDMAKKHAAQAGIVKRDTSKVSAMTMEYWLRRRRRSKTRQRRKAKKHINMAQYCILQRSIHWHHQHQEFVFNTEYYHERFKKQVRNRIVPLWERGTTKGLCAITEELLQMKLSPHDHSAERTVDAPEM